ncbi:MAG: BMP family ABC transporter substrate-binding protein [Atopobiaceae bacterium]|nr:BMP family ABC transporter substrate-binding protein [Atopobiaceae bacterium]
MKVFDKMVMSRRSVVTLGLAGGAALSLAACGGSSTSAESSDAAATADSSEGATIEGIKAGLICLHDEQSTYDKNFIDAFKSACENLGIESEIKTNIPEGQECYDAACELVDDGCNIIFADSFGHEDFMISAAEENPEVQFCHATGVKAHTSNLPNFHNAFASIYEGRYLAGIAAGMKIKEMIEAGDIKENEAKMGYVGAYPYAEVKSGYTSFYLGAKSVVPSVTMDVTFTNSWYDETAEKEGANKLIDDKCVLISQHADSMGAPTACENANIPNVSYNGSTVAACPKTFIVSSRIDWAPYYEYAVGCVQNGEAIDVDWVGTLSTGSVLLTELNDAAAAKGTAEAIETAKSQLEDGTLHVFDTSTFTVKKKELTSYKADVDFDEKYEPDTEVISDGYFHESENRSAPYFDIDIDGITILGQKK